MGSKSFINMRKTPYCSYSLTLTIQGAYPNGLIGFVFRGRFPVASGRLIRTEMPRL
uniref:Uncharacterized protein n=1 Tax=Lepeophtheirus salmonis TaxID=72036 RepID=A0A0K2ULE7_LEPSM